MTKKEFDRIIKNSLIISGKAAADFRTDRYDTYYTDTEFAGFVNRMKNGYPRYYNKLSEGYGHELTPHNNGAPPKMASVASSSRFCYLALRDGAEALGGGEVEAELECRIRGVRGTAPQLDAYSKQGDIFIEAKCHEMYDAHPLTISGAYWEKLYGEGNGFEFEVKKASPKPEQFELNPCEFGINKALSLFDFKQLLCHLLGVKEKSSDRAQLIYLYFKPKCADRAAAEKVELLFNELSEEITAVFAAEKIKNFLRRNNISLKAAAEYDSRMSALTSDNLIWLYR